ncbi:MAG: inositol monophosphatase [Bacteroidales bacterium]|nr:inositol monophosphatase [Bacteroidales bacterium]MCF8391926.1 inositol monophosphatase [Bacteroidales bacterium]
MIVLKDICFQVIDLVKETSELIIRESQKGKNLGLEVKGRHNYVTRVDKASEEKLVEGLSKIIPDSGFIAEEETSTKKGEKYNWVIDPIDGTTNFIHGLFPFAISVALMENDEVVIGVVYELGLKECFYAWKGSESFLNGEIIKASVTKTVNESLLATGFPYTDYEYMDEFFESLKYFMKNSHGLRRLGSAATDIVYVACGRFDGFYEYGLHAWDIAAACFILERAGGKSTDFSGGKNYLFGGELVSSNSEIFNEFQQTVNKLMKPC